MNSIKEKPAEQVWANFKEVLNLTDEQLEQFKKYEELLGESNKNINLTAIKSLSGVVRQHFQDSVALQDFVDLKEIKTIADVGSGAGFPAIPLKILYPNLNVILIEVTKKKQEFLKELVEVLELENVEICDLDWRTFLRTTEANVDLFLTRAALNDLELCRVFKPSCFYKNSKLIYWVSDEWTVNPKVEKYLKELKPYVLGRKARKLAFFELK